MNKIQQRMQTSVSLGMGLAARRAKVASPAPPGLGTRLDIPAPLLWAIALAWMLVLAIHGMGRADLMGHDGLAADGVLRSATLGLLFWQVMIAAMMLPTSLPLIKMFWRTSASQPHFGAARGAFLAGYTLLWSAFGVAALSGDVGIHALVDSWDWLESRPWLVGGAVLLAAGGFQFSTLKDRCLQKCRHPALFLLEHYRPGVPAALRLGTVHGLYCLGCCWALMLTIFAVGMTNLVWMATLTAVMVFEKTSGRGERVVVPTGIGFVAMSGLVLVAGAK